MLIYSSHHTIPSIRFYKLVWTSNSHFATYKSFVRFRDPEYIPCPQDVLFIHKDIFPGHQGVLFGKLFNECTGGVFLGQIAAHHLYSGIALIIGGIIANHSKIKFNVSAVNSSWHAQLSNNQERFNFNSICSSYLSYTYISLLCIRLSNPALFVFSSHLSRVYIHTWCWSSCINVHNR